MAITIGFSEVKSCRVTIRKDGRRSQRWSTRVVREIHAPAAQVAQAFDIPLSSARFSLTEDKGIVELSFFRGGSMFGFVERMAAGRFWKRMYEAQKHRRGDDARQK